ncbi:hypothetical protein IPA_00270 [Ignicoccus pacificus DSM 13166]|uniref:Uncharacterized protein n=1 Tax=Ignicoccus pacificus DSM 13166 TaxID=940294 RepID=A0A977KAB3_9CREN|nr:hypothetical protein IPA_00270 [Ignicoccus pacificus DSM 13166]
MRSFLSLVLKDVKEETRRPHEPLALASLAAAFALPISYLISGPGTTVNGIVEASNLVVIGQIALTILITSLLGFLLIIREAERGTIYALKLAPITPEVMFLSKVLVIFIFMVPLSLVYLFVTSFLGAMSFVTLNYLVYILSLSLYMSALGSLVSFMIIYTDVGTLLASVAIAALSAPYLFSTAPTAVDCIVGSPSLGFVYPSVAFLVLATLLGKFLIEL